MRTCLHTKYVRSLLFLHCLHKNPMLHNNFTGSQTLRTISCEFCSNIYDSVTNTYTWKPSVANITNITSDNAGQIQCEVFDNITVIFSQIVLLSLIESYFFWYYD